MTDFADGNRLELLESGREYFPALEAACDEARHEIHIETYIYEDDSAGRRIAEALKRAARRGVAVYLLVDAFGSKRLSKKFIAELEHSGVKVLIYRRDIALWRSPRQRLRRMHRKLAIVDGRVAFVGGINIIDDMHTPGHIHAAAKRLWTIVQLTQLGGGWPDTEGPLPESTARGHQRAAFVVRDNLWHRKDIEEAYLEAIGQARSEILIASSYFFPGLAFRHALADAAARGVRVTLLLQARVEYRLLHYASRALYGALLDAGIEIHEYYKSFLHAKVAVINGNWATVGSSNIDPFSLLVAREANVVVDDATFAQELRASLANAMAAGAREVRPEQWRTRPLFERVAYWLCYGFARLLTGVGSYGQAREYA
jgi:cardiolipin synthase A/B